MNILYLGTKGAGPGLAFSFANELEVSKRLNYVIVSKKNELLEKFVAKFPAKLITLDVPNNLIGALNIFNLIKFFRSVKIANAGSAEYLIPMHHPWSILFCILTRNRKFSIIHDFIPHDGDRKIVLRIANFAICKSSDKTLFLSDHQRNAAIESGYIKEPSSGLIRHPTFYHYDYKNISAERDFDFIFFGRLEPYKGLSRLIDSFKYLRVKYPWLKLHVCGRPGVGFNADILKVEGVYTTLHYIADTAVPRIMSSAKVAALPYDDATQSGVMVLANDFNCYTVITPAIGLVEQSQIITNVFISKSFDVIDFAETMMDALNSFKERKNEPINSGLLEVI